MIGARRLLTRHTSGSSIYYTTPYEDVSAIVSTPFDYHYNDHALLEVIVYMPNGRTKMRRFWSYTNAQNYAENRMVDAIRQIRKAGAHR